MLALKGYSDGRRGRLGFDVLASVKRKHDGDARCPRQQRGQTLDAVFYDADADLLQAQLTVAESWGEQEDDTNGMDPEVHSLPLMGGPQMDREVARAA